jgi:hypothetical protein
MSPAQAFYFAAKLEISADFPVVQYPVAIDHRQRRTRPVNNLVGLEL